MATIYVFSKKYKNLMVDDLVEKLKDKGWEVLVYRDNFDLKPFVRCNLNNAFFVGMKKSDQDPKAIKKKIKKPTDIKELREQNIVCNIHLVLNKDFDYGSDFYQNHGQDEWEHEQKVLPPEIMEYVNKSKVYYEVSDGDFANESSMSVEFVEDFGMIMAEMTGGLLENETSSEFLLDGQQFKRLDIPRDFRNCTICGKTMREDDEYGSYSTGEKVEILCSDCISDGVPTEQFLKYKDGWYDSFKDNPHIGDEVERVMKDIA